HSYGAVLQAYALQQELTGLGGEVEVIDYRPAYLLDPYRLFPIRQIILSGSPVRIAKNAINAIICLPIIYMRRKKFNTFISSAFTLSPLIDDTIPQDYALYVLGSDQIWNHKITQGFDGVFFGDFKASHVAKKITYAASMGYGDID